MLTVESLEKDRRELEAQLEQTRLAALRLEGAIRYIQAKQKELSDTRSAGQATGDVPPAMNALQHANGKLANPT